MSERLGMSPPNENLRRPKRLTRTQGARTALAVSGGLEARGTLPDMQDTNEGPARPLRRTVLTHGAAALVIAPTGMGGRSSADRGIAAAEVPQSMVVSVRSMDAVGDG